jgi:hypothetical protein
MSKFAALAAVLALAAAVPTAAAYDLPLGETYDLPEELLAFIAATPPEKDFAVGSGRFTKGQPADAFNLSAHGSPTDAHGHVRFNVVDFAEEHGRVDCLFVMGNRAAAAGAFTDPSGPFTDFTIVVEDNGEPGKGSPDQALLLLEAPPLGALDCGLEDALLLSALLPIEQGNIVVKDR